LSVSDLVDGRRVAAALFIVLSLSVVAACGGSTPAGSAGATDAAAGPTEEPGEGATPPPAGERSFYAFDPAGSRVILVNPDGGDVADVATLEHPAYAMDVADGIAWLGLDDGSVVRLDLADGSTTPVATGVTDAVTALVVADGSVWTLHGAPGLPTTVTRIDPATNAVTATTPSAEGVSFYGLDADAGSGWLFGNSPTMATTLYQVDPATGAITDREVQMIIRDIDVADGVVWLGGTIFPDGAQGVPGVGRFDPSSGTLTTLEVPGEPQAITAAEGAVWAVNGTSPDGLVAYRIDPATMQVATTIPLGEADSGLVRATSGAGYVWVTTSDANYAIDPSDDTVAGQADAPGSLGVYYP
jgi:DNA-binding beta-propeller fold protein YncE